MYTGKTYGPQGFSERYKVDEAKKMEPPGSPLHAIRRFKLISPHHQSWVYIPDCILEPFNAGVFRSRLSPVRQTNRAIPFDYSTDENTGMIRGKGTIAPCYQRIPGLAVQQLQKFRDKERNEPEHQKQRTRLVYKTSEKKNYTCTEWHVITPGKGGG